mgnify:CR=1 FL=1
MTFEIKHGDCLEVMRGMADNCVDAIVTDPPYFKVKSEAWDRQWDKPHQFIEWMGQLAEQWQRILRPNGSLYVFASPKMAARVEVKIADRFEVLQSVVWFKGNAGRGAQAEKEAMRNWWPGSERIIFAEHYGADNIAKGEAGYEAKCDELRGFVFEPLRSYLAEEVKRAEWTPGRLNEAMGFAPRGMAETRYFGRSQWQLPTEPHYTKMRELLGPEYLRREYEDLRREYEDLRREYEDLRRPFSVTARDQWSDVWDFDPVQAYPGKHPCEKPLPLLCHILSASTKPGAVVFDPFAGSASLGEACHELGRKFIGVELCPDNYAKAARRIEAVKAQERLFA